MVQPGQMRLPSPNFKIEIMGTIALRCLRLSAGLPHWLHHQKQATNQ
jgi:hypothetical protein